MITGGWLIKHHNEAVRFINLGKGNIEQLKAYVDKMVMSPHCIDHNKSNIVWVRNCFHKIINYYEETGFLEEFETGIHC